MNFKNTIFHLIAGIVLSIGIYACGKTISDLVDPTDPVAPESEQEDTDGAWVGFRSGRLVYHTDDLGNRVPDFSGVGYMNSEEDIPTVPVVKTIHPHFGGGSDWDDTPRIQAEIDELSSQEPLSSGFRGALYFAPGEYRLKSTVTISHSGIVLRGAGAGDGGTTLIATGREQYDLIHFAGPGSVSADSRLYAIIDPYVPVGTTEVTVNQVDGLNEGDWVYQRRSPKSAWITDMGAEGWNWTIDGYIINYERRITAISMQGGSHIVHLDAPVVDMIDEKYADGYLVKINSDARITHCGIEDMRIESVYESETDEDHAWTGVLFTRITNGWARNIDAYYFGFGAVRLGSTTRWVTVDNCRMIDPKSQTTGNRKYPFLLTGQRNLVKNCYARAGRHDYATGGRVPGPNVFFNCVSEGQLADNGPHQRWATGILYDRVVGDGDLNVRNRSTNSSGHGWTGAQHMLWRCEGRVVRLQRPPLGHLNWAVECTNVTGKGTGSSWSPDEPLGEVQDVAPVPSLFEQQLADRLRR